MSHRFRTITDRRTTTQRGYDTSHQREAKARRAVTTPAHLCGYCGKPLGPERLPGDRASRWELPHNPTRTGYLPGLWHRDCNRREAAIRGNQRQRAKRHGQGRRAQSQAW